MAGIEPLDQFISIEPSRGISSDYKDISVHLPISCLAVKLSELLVFKDHLSASDIQTECEHQSFSFFSCRKKIEREKELKMLNVRVWRWKKVGQADETKHDTKICLH